MKNKKENLRPPVVVILGHVDHGKSSILEAIKDLKITVKESGGITQHIAAYEIEHQGKKITFVDTPGHEAFSAMRSRGVHLADIAILVIAAEEGIKNQTKEAIDHIKKAEIPMIVALNKIDKPEADPEKIKGQLAKEDIVVESMGGKVPSIGVSAKTKKGITDLLELILLVSEMEDLKGDASLPAKGVIIESNLDSKRGLVATLIVEDGTLKKGDIIGTASVFGKVKIMEDFQGSPIDKALPSTPVILIGFETVPKVGESFKVFDTIEKAKQGIGKDLEKVLKTPAKDSDKRILNIILKSDVAGSLEAITEVLKDIPQDKALIKILKSEIGEISESDIKFAHGAKASIIGFRVKANRMVQNLATREKVKIKTFDIIYELAQAVREALAKILESETVRTDLCKVKILAIFRTEKSRQIIGGKVTEGGIKKGVSVEVFRNEEMVGKGKIINLQRDKKEIVEVSKGSECGMFYEGNIQVEQGDILQAFTQERRKLEL